MRWLATALLLSSCATAPYVVSFDVDVDGRIFHCHFKEMVKHKWDYVPHATYECDDER